MTEKEKALTDILYQIYDEAGHIIETEAENHKEVAIQNSKEIKKLTSKGLELLS